MYVKYLRLKNYRNYDELYIELNSKVNVFIGDNAQGKTNILESIYFCSIGKSHRTNKDKELIRWDQREASISVHVAKERLDKRIDITIPREGKKTMSINSIKMSKVSDLIGILNVVMFSPEDLKIVKESPSHRRRFMDIELCKLNKKYYYNLVQYNKVLEERNSALKKWRQMNSDILDIYDDQIAGYGSYIISERQKFIEMLNQKGQGIHRDITSGREEIRFKYITCGAGDIRKSLLENRERDFERKTTSVGPHRDDFDISINGIDTRSYGSQGQQRTSVLTIKFATIEIIREMTGEYPVLLLDDVLSELDINRQRYILNSINSIQTIITCTGISDIKEYLEEGAAIYMVSVGSVKKYE